MSFVKMLNQGIGYSLWAKLIQINLLFHLKNSVRNSFLRFLIRLIFLISLNINAIDLEPILFLIFLFSHLEYINSLEKGLGGMKNIRAFIRKIVDHICDFDITQNKLPYWMEPLRPVQKFSEPLLSLHKDRLFTITENVCGLTVNYGFVRRGIFTRFVAYDKNNRLITDKSILTAKMRQSLADIRTLL